MPTPTDEQDQGVWLTQEAYDRLKAELDQLVAGRPAMAAEINARREEGDLRENGGYHAAREEQGQIESRIRQLQELLRTAKVGDVPTESGVAKPGSVLTVRYEGEDETEQQRLLLTGRTQRGGDAFIQVRDGKVGAVRPRKRAARHRGKVKS